MSPTLTRLACITLLGLATSVPCLADVLASSA
jgi:predicted amino acid racemase